MPTGVPRIRIAMIIEATMGGTRTHLMHLLRGLPRERFDVTLIASAERDARFRPVMEELRRDGIRVLEVPMVRRPAPVRDAIAFLMLVRALRKLDWDIVHTHASKAGALGRLAALACGARRGGRIVHTPHNFPFQGRGCLAGWIFRTVEQVLARWTDRLVVLTEYQRGLALSGIGMPSGRVAVIPNGVDGMQFARSGRRDAARMSLGLDADVPLVGWIGRLMPQKRCDVFLRSAARVRVKVPSARFLVVGEGPLERRLRRLAGGLGISDAILWQGFTEDPRPFYEAMDVFSLTSDYEGMPYTLLEAMAMEVPPVAPAIGGCDEVLTPETGILVRPREVEGFAEAIAALLGDPVLRQRMGRAARERVIARFSLDSFLAATASLYESVAA